MQLRKAKSDLEYIYIFKLEANNSSDEKQPLIHLECRKSNVINLPISVWLNFWKNSLISRAYHVECLLLAFCSVGSSGSFIYLGKWKVVLKGPA